MTAKLRQVLYITIISILSALIYFTLLSRSTSLVHDREDDISIQTTYAHYTGMNNQSKTGEDSHSKPAAFSSNVMCPPNIYSAKASVENGTMKIAGPMGCVVSFLPDPLEALTSNPLDENEKDSRWIITSGGSTHWGASMNLLRLFLKEGDEISTVKPKPPDVRGSAHWSRSIDVLQLYLNESDEIPTVKLKPPDVVELKIGRDGVPKLKVWMNFEDYSCSWQGKDADQNILIRVTVLYCLFMDHSADRFERFVKNCGHHRPKPALIVDVRGKWYEFCPNPMWPGCIRHQQVNETNVKRKYKSDANILLQTTNSIEARSVLFVDRSQNAENVKKRKAPFQRNGKGTHLTLQYESSTTYPHLVVADHQSSAFAVGAATAFLHTILGQRHQASNSVDQGCYDISFTNDVCNPRHIDVYKNSWAFYYLHHCATEAVSCIERSNHAKVSVPSHEHSDYIHSTSPQLISVLINGFSSSVRRGLVVVSVSLIVTFVYIEGKKAPTNSMPGLGTLRFIASLHIVAGHLQRFGRDYMTPVPFAEFGYTWVPWFMLLSAFILSWSAVNKIPRRECPTWYEFVLLRVRGIYPLYIAGLIATAISSPRHISPRRYIIDLLLFQSWYPGWTEGAIMPHTWFLSAIIPCWMLHGFLFRRIEEVSTKNILLFCALVTFLPMFIFGVVQCWWCDHETNQFNSIVDALVIMSKFHPLCYLHIYASGICIAHLLHRWKALQEGEGMVQDESCIIANGIELIKPSPDAIIEDAVDLLDDDLLDASIEIDGNKLSHPCYFHPSRAVHCLIRYGCSIGAAGTFMSFFLGRIYHFHGAKLAFRLGFLLPWHALLLIGSAVGSPRDPVRRLFESQCLQIFGNVSYAQYIFQFIWFHKWYGHVDAGFWVFCVASSILVYYLIDRPCKTKKWIHSGGGIAVTSFLILAVGRYAHIDVGTDSKIMLWASDDAHAHRWMNPSIVWANHTTLLVSARRLRIDTPASGLGSIWSSDLGIGELKMSTDKYGLSLNAHSALRIIKQNSSEVTSCHTPSMWIRGVEDPRLLMVNGSLYLTAVHHTQKKDLCVASPTLVHLNEAWTNHRFQRIQTPHHDMTSTKNWVHMRDHHFMTNITTSSVVRINPLGGEVDVISYGEPSSWLLNMHGGSNLVESTSVIDKAKVWIGVIHSAETYRNHLVEFEYNKPYVSL